MASQIGCSARSQSDGPHYAPKEHQGGSPSVGHIAISSWEEEHFDVQIVEAKYPDDTLEDQAREALNGGKFREFVSGLVTMAREEERKEDLAAFLAYVTESKNRSLSIDELIYASGLHTLERLTASDLAKKHGISKQAFAAGVKRAAVQLRLRKSVEMRDENARRAMRLRNKRQNKMGT